MKLRRLGHTNIEVTPVGIGTLTMGFSQKNLSIEEGSEIIRYAVEQGINFVDTAQYYDTYRYIHPALDALRAEGAELPVICSKTLEADYEGARAAVLECLEELNLSKVHIFLLHEIRGVDDFYGRSEAWKALQDMRNEGLIEAIGVSTHHVDVCELMADTEVCDVVFPLINEAGLGIRTVENGEDIPATREMMEEAIRKCAENGVGVFTMKAFGGGNLVERYVSCLDYATSIPGNTAVMIGMSSKEQVDAAASYFEGKIDREYTPDVSGKRLMVDQSDCEGCGTCKDRCASHAIYWNENGLASIDSSKCVRCGYCAPVCPVRAVIFL